MSQSSNNELSLSIVAVVAILGVIALVQFFVLSMMAGGIGSSQIDGIPEDTAIVDARIKPVVTLADIRGEGSNTLAAAPVVAKKSAKELYNVACMACHANGVAGAPKPNDKADWEARYANGMDSLLAAVVNGKGAMPAKGGSTFTDSELTSIIEYMLVDSGVMDAKPETPADTTPTNNAPMTEKTAEPTAQVNMDIDLAAGEKAYGSACGACHNNGVAGAPKLGDAAAWAAPKASGIDASTTAAINGKGAMPPKGGASFLSDDDVKNIVGYMFSKI